MEECRGQQWEHQLTLRQACGRAMPDVKAYAALDEEVQETPAPPPALAWPRRSSLKGSSPSVSKAAAPEPAPPEPPATPEKVHTLPDGTVLKSFGSRSSQRKQGRGSERRASFSPANLETVVQVEVEFERTEWDRLVRKYGTTVKQLMILAIPLLFFGFLFRLSLAR